MHSIPHEPPRPGGRPLNVTWGVRLLWAALVAGLPSLVDGFNLPSEQADRDLQQFIVLLQVSAAAILAITAWLTVMTWIGRNWARVTYLVLFLLGVLIGLWVPVVIPGETTHEDVVYLLQVALDLAGLALLFTPSANGWYRAVRAARRG